MHCRNEKHFLKGAACVLTPFPGVRRLPDFYLTGRKLSGPVSPCITVLYPCEDFRMSGKKAVKIPSNGKNAHSR